MQLRQEITHKLFDLFIFIGSQELEIEKAREKLVIDPDFEPFSAFKRIARMGDKVGKRDVHLYLR